MMFKEIKPEQLDRNIFDLIKNNWGVLTVDCDNKINAMTVSWVQMGQLWNKDVITVYVRPQRYTYNHIIEKEDFSLAFFDGYKKELGYLGKESGRDFDKLKKCGFTISKDGSTPYINEANIIFIIKKLYSNTIKKDNFIDKSIIDYTYQEEDFHMGFVGEIVKILIKSDD
ncbi:MAG: flavin reductase family protein [Erysipelotrichaceae bacterium]|nr:flavin reductase family protein [Erysipelotrichaceae bacterium]